MAADSIEASLQPGLILRLSPAEYISHLRAVAASAPADQHGATVAAITSQLQSHVHSSAIPPILFSMWLPMALPRLPQLLKDVLGDKESIGVRKAGRKQLRRAHKGRNWSENGWEALGGIDGVCNLFNSLSVSDAHPLVMAIAEGARSSGIAGDEAVDRLLEALTDGTSEVRRLEMTDIARLLLSCSTPFIIEWLQKKPLPSFPLHMVFKSLVAGRLDLARNIATGAVNVHPEVRSLLVENLPAELIWSPVPYQPKYTPVELSSNSLPGARFYFDLLHSFQDERMLKTCPSTKGILDNLHIAEKHAIRHNAPFDDILSLLQLGLATAALQIEKPKFEPCGPRLIVLLHYWSIAKYPDYAPKYSIDLDKSPEAARWDRKKHPVAVLSHHRHPLSALSHPSRPNAKHESDLEKLIVHVVKSVPESSIPARHMSHVICELFRLLPNQHFAPGARLLLIKLLYRHVPTVRVDLDSPQLSDEEWRRIDLDAEIFTMIPSSDSRWLFSRLPNLAAAENLITFRRADPGSSLDGHGPWWFKYGQLKMVWEVEDAHSEGGFHETLKLLENVKTEAEKSRDPDTRSMWADIAARLAIRSKSVAILKDVTVWSRRYLRDHIVYPGITRTLISSRQDNILSCVTLCPNRRPASLAELKSLVDEANSLLLLHIEGALQYLREPGFQPLVYQHFSTLLCRIFSERIDGVQTLQRLGLGSESELVSILIESMMPILTLYEETSLADGNEQLGWIHPNGITSYFKPRLLALPFLDELARRRDELWARNRLNRNDLVSTLDEGWPKGLPIQSLLLGEQWMAQALATPEAAPFIADRVKRVIFCDPEIALVAVPRNRDVIGPFVDSLPIAIRSYVGSGSSAEVFGRIQRVWEHYSQVIPAAAGHIEMVKSLLKKIAAAAGIEWMKEDMASPPPSLPVSENNPGVDLEPVEWDPRPNGGGCDDEIMEIDEVDKKPKNLLLCRLSATEGTPHWQWKEHIFKEPENWSPAKPVDSQQSFWRTWVNQIHKLPTSSRDAVVASAMLYLDAFAAGDIRLISNQFPAGVLHPRYPPMYLDYEFLSSIGKSSNTREYINDAILALRKLKSIVPPALLRDLANSMLNKLIHKRTYGGNYCDNNYRILESATFKVISLLSLTDQPRLAYSLAVRVVEKMPGSSSWHRKLISVGLCRRLCSTHAEEMLQNFSCFILASIERQRANNETEKVGRGLGLDPDEKQYVKVTTLKLLAELLQSGNFVSGEISLDILQSLFVKSNHIDVKAAALGAIIDLLGKNVRLGLEPDIRVYNALTLFSDAAAGPDERSVVSEAEWIAAENGGPLPNCDDHRPLLDLFLTAKCKIPAKFHDDYVRSVLLKIFDKSTRQHTRWMRIFLGRCKLSTKEAPVALFGPFIDNYENKLLSSWSDCISKDYLLRSRELSMGYRDCERLAHIEKELNAGDPTLAETDAGMHWKNYLQSRMDYKLAFGTLGQLVMSKDLQPRFPNGITLEDVEEEYFQRVTIAAREPRYRLDGNPIVSLKPFEFAINILLSCSDAGNMPESRRRLLERIVADVRDLHSQTWPEGSPEKPPLLPSLWNLRCILAMTSPTAELVESVNSLCEECAQSSFAMGDYKQLVKAVGTITSDSQISLLVKLGEAAQNEHDTFAGCIKVQLAHYLLRKIKDITTMERRTEVESLLKSWLNSSNENTRRIAFNVTEKFASIKANNFFASRFGYRRRLVSEDDDEDGEW